LRVRGSRLAGWVALSVDLLRLGAGLSRWI